MVEYKADSILEAKRKRALDKHLDFIVGQTEKFSSLVQEGLARPSVASLATSDSTPDERGMVALNLAEVCLGLSNKVF